MTDTKFVRVRTRTNRMNISTVDVLLDEEEFVDRFGISIESAPPHYVHLFVSEKVLDDGEPILSEREHSETSYDHAVLPYNYYIDK